MRANDLADAFDKAEEHARLLLGNDPAREEAVIEIGHSCPGCKGQGRVLKKRCKATYLDCVACRGYGWLTIAEARMYQGAEQ